MRDVSGALTLACARLFADRHPHALPARGTDADTGRLRRHALARARHTPQDGAGRRDRLRSAQRREPTSSAELWTPTLLTATLALKEASKREGRNLRIRRLSALCLEMRLSEMIHIGSAVLHPSRYVLVRQLPVPTPIPSPREHFYFQSRVLETGQIYLLRLRTRLVGC